MVSLNVIRSWKYVFNRTEKNQKNTFPQCRNSLPIPKKVKILSKNQFIPIPMGTIFWTQKLIFRSFYWIKKPQIFPKLSLLLFCFICTSPSQFKGISSSDTNTSNTQFSSSLLFSFCLLSEYLLTSISPWSFLWSSVLWMWFWSKREIEESTLCISRSGASY